MLIDWHQIAHHYRQALKNTSGALALSVQRARSEQQKRIDLAVALADILMDIAYDDDDPDHEYCNVCTRSLIEEDGHAPGCLLIEGLTMTIDGARAEV